MSPVDRLMPAAWRAWQPYGACSACIYGRDATGARLVPPRTAAVRCAALGGPTRPVDLMRANDGACGPEAHLQVLVACQPARVAA